MSAVPSFDELSDIDAANVVRCARVLLRRPLLHQASPDGDLLPMIYRQRGVLQELFANLLDYRLVVQRRFARLHKAGPGEDPTRGEPSLGPRGYAYLALTLAALTGIGRQVLLSRLVSDVRAAAGEAGVAVSDDQVDRRALTAALRHLVALGVVQETEGTVTAEAQAEALITIDTELLGQLVTGPLAEATGPENLIGRAASAGPRGTERAVRRRLVEDPAVLHDELPGEQARWLRQNQAGEARLLERYFGLVTETREEGAAASDPEDYLTDLVFPGPGTVSRIALLALPELLSGEPGPTGRHRVARRQVRQVCEQLVESYPAAWSRQATEDLDELTSSVVSLLHRLGLLGPTGDGSTADEWLLSPVAHRWAPSPDASPAPGREPESPPAPEPAGWSLFDDVEEEAGR